MSAYKFEKEGQIEFFKHFGINPDDEDGVKLINSTDGIYKGTIFEFKLHINNINHVLFQAIKYLSRQRTLGHSIPKHILLVSLNTEIAYLYDSSDFIGEIEKIYVGAASKNNDAFDTKIKHKKISDINSRNKGLKQIEKIIDDETYTKINIDENCVVGWAERFYLEKNNATKIQLFNELRNPNLFKDFINPWKGKEEDFKYIMDCLNDPQHKKELGVFYTPKEYCELALTLVRKAIKEIPKAHTYVIIDRCAGTGNLEQFMTAEELAHTIVATYELKEWEVLYKRIGDKVRTIIPPRPDHNKGLMIGGDALAQDVFDECRQYVDDPKCNVILFENPPFRDVTSNTKGKANSGFTNFIKKKMANEFNGPILNQKDNLFIWSGFKYYLKKDDDSYILFSPIRYWKSHHIVNRKFIYGYLVNRKWFHANQSSISLIWWKNNYEKNNTIRLAVLDISCEYGLVAPAERKFIDIKKVCKKFSNEYYDKRTFENDGHGLVATYDGKETNKKPRLTTKYNENILGYLRASSYNLDNNSVALLTIATYDGNGFYIRKDNFLNCLPLFCAKLYPQKEWYQRDIYFTTADKGNIYQKDNELLKSSLIFSCLINSNHCLSFLGSDGRFYRNELCFTLSNGEDYPLTCADKELSKFKLNNDENELLKLWDEILIEIEGCKNFNSEYTYGTYQIDQELNTSFKDQNDKTIYDYPELNTKLNSLRILLSTYYEKYIQDKLFKYELLK